MSEQVTKYLDTTRHALNSIGAQCGQGLPQKSLKDCPKERFCAFPGGEMCIYSADQLSQIMPAGGQTLAVVTVSEGTPPAATPKEITAAEGFAVAAVFIAGIALGRFWPKVRKT